ncbi:MAG: GHKL domain-containing protein [Eubacterium sp.]|nr:GHKL domain-containing protein [Eubacterium sp.]
MSWLIAEIAAIIAECFIVTRTLIRYFKLKTDSYERIKWLSLFFLLFLVDTAGSFFVKNEVFQIASCLAVEIGFSVIFLKGNFFEKCLISIINYLMLYFINIPILMLMGMIGDTTADELATAQDINRIVCLFVTKLLYLAATQSVLWLKRREEFHFKRNEWIIVVSTFTITLLIGFMMNAITIHNAFSGYSFLAVALLLSALDVVVFIFMQKMNLAAQNEKERELLDLELKNQQSELKQMEQQYREISVLKHDFKNNIDCIRSLMLDGNIKEAIGYADKLKERRISPIQTQILLSNPIVNAVINSKFSEAAEKGIDTSLRLVIKIPEYLEFDLSILLSNLLDNAIEACVKNTSDSQIILTISEIDGYYRIVIRNTIDASVLQSNKSLKTNKADPAQHGWGLKSVKDIVDKYDGLIDIYENSNMFFVDILLTKSENNDISA